MKIKSTRRAGFTLVEVMIIVVIVGLLATMAIQTFRRIREASLATTVANDFRIYRDAFETYALHEGTWPNTADAGVTPDDMDDWIHDFDLVTAVGGNWDWEVDGTYDASLRILSSTATEEIMRRIDLIVDDGDVTTGAMRSDIGTGNIELILDE